VAGVTAGLTALDTGAAGTGLLAVVVVAVALAVVAVVAVVVGLDGPEPDPHPTTLTNTIPPPSTVAADRTSVDTTIPWRFTSFLIFRAKSLGSTYRQTAADAIPPLGTGGLRAVGKDEFAEMDLLR
jgi:hypothetical protein